MMTKRTTLAAAFTLATLISGPAWADNSSDAEALYQQGMSLLGEKKLEAACLALEKSEKLEARGGTLLSLAYCHEQQGKSALSYSEYDESLRRLRLGGGRRDRENFATERMAVVKDKVTFVSLELAPTVNAANVEVVIQPSKAGDAERKLVMGADRSKSIALDADGGAYRIEVRATDRKPFVAQVQVTGKTAAPASIVVSELAPEGAGAGGGPAVPEADGSGQRTLGLILGGSGVVLAGVGAVFGVLAIGCAKDVREGNGCSPSQAKNVDANIANVGIGLGAVGIVVGGYLFLTAPKGGPAPEKAVAFRPTFGPSSAGFALDGRF